VLRIFLVTAWLLALAGALAGLAVYKGTPGSAGVLAASWPAESALERGERRPTLILFAHPKCPCTRASLTELRGVASRFGDRTTTYVVFIQPAGTPREWVETPAWRDAASFGARVVADVDGKEAARFGAKTSGHVVLFDARGVQRFAGGITGSRGHVGPNAALAELTAILDAETRSVVTTATSATTQSAQTTVYGCPLKEKKDE
jgi:hypothetical protein